MSLAVFGSFDELVGCSISDQRAQNGRSSAAFVFRQSRGRVRRLPIFFGVAVDQQAGRRLPRACRVPMAFLFGRGKKSPTELVKSTKQLLATFSSGAPAAPVAAAAAADADPGVTKSSEKISANLSAMKLMLYGDGDHEAKPELIEKLVEELFAAELLLDLLRNISKFEFETRKDVAMVFNFLLRRGQHNLAVQYVESHSEVIKLLVEVRRCIAVHGRSALVAEYYCASLQHRVTRTRTSP